MITNLPRTHTVRVDPTACTAHGLCAAWLPERVRLDEWGYPIVSAEPVPPDLLDLARKAAAECPTRALRLSRTEVLLPGS